MGAICRFLISQHFIVAQSVFPFSTLLINLLGCFILGFFFTFTLDYLTINPAIRTGFGTGFIGAFTTFSTFSVETIQLLQMGFLLQSVLYLLLSLLGCTLLSAFGTYLAHLVGGKKTVD